MIDEDKVRHVAKLARINLTDDEVKKFSSQLNKVFGYVEILNEVDTKNVPETSQVTGLKNVMEKDEVLPSPKRPRLRGLPTSSKELLDCSELNIDSNQVRVGRAIK